MLSKFKNLVDSGTDAFCRKDSTESLKEDINNNITPEQHINNIKNIIDTIEVIDQEDINRLVKSINIYLFNNPDINKIDTKILNTEIYIKGYAFSKNKGKQQLIKKQYTPCCRSKTKPLEDSINNCNNNIETQQYKIKQLENILEDNINRVQNNIQDVDSRYKDIINRLQQRIEDLEKENKTYREDLDRIVNFIKQFNNKQIEIQQQLQMQQQISNGYNNKWKVNI